MPISSGALGWPKSHWCPPPKFDISKNRIIYPAAEWAKRRAQELKNERVNGRLKRKRLTKIRIAMTKLQRRRLKRRCLIALLVLVITILIGVAGFLIWWFIWKGKPNC